MIYEMRTYEIPNNVRGVFQERFENKAMPLMNKHGFKVIGCWDEAIGDMQNFIYILEWPDMGARMTAWKAFNSDADWVQIKKEYAEKYGELVRKTSNRILSPTAYSPIK